MGQAKLKGDKESRVAVGIAATLHDASLRSGGSYVFARLFPGAQRARVVDHWINGAVEVAQQNRWPSHVHQAFVHVLAFIWIKAYQGACHSTSAGLAIVLREHGLNPLLCVGEVKSDKGIFDHSWIELDGLVLDAAVSMPLPGGAMVGGPVFASRCLDNGKLSPLIYGASSGIGLGADAIQAASNNLLDYSRLQPSPTIWELAAGVLKVMGNGASVSELRDKHGHITRIVRGLANWKEAP